MKEWVIKTFFKHKAVKILLADEAGRLITHWAIPDKDNIVKLIGVKKAIILPRESMLLTGSKNVPTFVVTYENCEPLNLKDLRASFYDASEFRLILDNDMAEKVFKATINKGISDEGKIIIVAVVIVGIALGYFFNTKFEDLQSIIEPPNPIVEVVEEADPYE